MRNLSIRNVQTTDRHHLTSVVVSASDDCRQSLAHYGLPSLGQQGEPPAANDVMTPCVRHSDRFDNSNEVSLMTLVRIVAKDFILAPNHLLCETLLMILEWCRVPYVSARVEFEISNCSLCRRARSCSFCFYVMRCPPMINGCAMTGSIVSRAGVARKNGREKKRKREKHNRKLATFWRQKRLWRETFAQQFVHLVRTLFWRQKGEKRESSNESVRTQRARSG